jgi:predicted DNA-binding transcriptional regulator YafY
VDGVEYLSLLFEAIVNKQPLKITYHPFHKTKPDTAIVSPYYIKQYNNRWFLFGVTSKNSKLTNMALDRIEAIEFSDEAYIPNTEYDFDEYFEDMIGVSIDSDSKVKKIRLRFSKDRLPYVLSKPIHGSQRHLHDEDANIELTLATNKEFYQQIFSFGNDVEILFPPEVRQKMAEKVAELNKLYKK